MEAFRKSPKRCSKIILFSFILGKQSFVERGEPKKFLGFLGKKIHLKKVPLQGFKPGEGYTKHRAIAQ